MEQGKFITMPFSYKLARFTLFLRKAYPFIAELCMRVEKHYKWDSGYAATDGLRLYLNEDQLGELPEEALNFVLLHELFHIMLRHQYPKGMPFYERIYWNIAFDLHINWLLMSMSGELRYYNLPIMPIAESALSTDDLSKDASNTIAEAFIRQALDQGILSVEPPPFVEICWKSFKAAVCHKDLYIFDVLDGSDIADAPADAQIRELFATCSKHAGKSGLPWNLRGLWDNLEKERILPWSLILKHYLEELKASEDFDFCPPDKRMLYSGLILPSETIEEGGELNNALIVLDVSSSVDRAELSAQVWQAGGILKELEFSGLVISFGSSVYQEAPLTNKASLKKFVDELKVGGGTDWGDVVRHVKRYKRCPKPIIVFTDGYFYSFDEGLRNVVFITQNDYPEDLRKLGKVIQIN